MMMRHAQIGGEVAREVRGAARDMLSTLELFSDPAITCGSWGGSGWRAYLTCADPVLKGRVPSRQKNQNQYLTCLIGAGYPAKGYP